MIVDEDNETTIDQAVEDFLEHYGVQGMKWGIRKDKFLRNRELNKASRAKDKAFPPKFTPTKKAPAPYSEKYKKNIDKARENIRTGRTDYDYVKAKFDHKKNKSELGSREARKILKKAKVKRVAELQTASQVRDGKEAAIKLIKDISREFQLQSQERARSYTETLRWNEAHKKVNDQAQDRRR
jgi:hypothetical protein